ncbi:hypothetical protein [Chitinophaga sp. RAB17]|uniref:hypothetical protein n=1 Tax=Chitinophaga sp. RAB17 TaxID=3233049 RepID=UPI003F8F7C09
MVFLLLMLFANSCKEQYGQLTSVIKKIDTKTLPAGSYVIIPNQGCEGCISTAEDFVKKHYATNENIRYIFTRIQSSKLLKVKLGSEVMGSSHVLLDTANVIVYPDKAKAIYPMIITMSDGHITGITYQSPDSDGFAELLKASH